MSKCFFEGNLLKIDACGNIKIEEVEDMLAGDDDYGTANRYPCIVHYELNDF